YATDLSWLLGKRSTKAENYSTVAGTVKEIMQELRFTKPISAQTQRPAECCACCQIYFSKDDKFPACPARRNDQRRR
ncbi:MAG: hypothetical protein WCA89_05055, partial [Terracidiphilus sp.]